MSVSAAILCYWQLWVCDVMNKVGKHYRSVTVVSPLSLVSCTVSVDVKQPGFLPLASQSFSALHWWRVNQDGCTSWNSGLNTKVLLLQNEYWYHNHLQAASGNICTFSTFVQQTSILPASTEQKQIDKLLHLISFSIVFNRFTVV